MTPTTIKCLWASGFVNRWHSHPDPRLRNAQDTTAAHSQRVAVLVATLFPDSPSACLLRALLHDAPESYTGDAPATPKRRYHSFQVVLDAAEATWWETVPDLRWVKDDTDPRVKLCDLLDAILFVGHVAPDLLDARDWNDDMVRALDMAHSLGVRDQVEELLT